MKPDPHSTVIRTDRLDLVAATIAHLDAELDSNDALESLLRAAVPSDWPPGEYDRAAIEFFRSRLREEPASLGWYTWYAVRRETQEEPAVLVGSGGYFGPPSGGDEVEIGYSICMEHRARGYAKEIVAALVSRAFSAGVSRVIAHTHAENTASVRALERSGFVLAGKGREPGTIRYVHERT